MEPSKDQEFVNELRKIFARELLKKWGLPSVFIYGGLILIAAMVLMYLPLNQQISGIRAFAVFAGCVGACFVCVGIQRQVILYFARRRSQDSKYFLPWIETYFDRERERHAIFLRLAIRFFEAIIPVASNLGFDANQTEQMIRTRIILSDRISKLPDVFYNRSQHFKFVAVGRCLEPGSIQ